MSKISNLVNEYFQCERNRRRFKYCLRLTSMWLALMLFISFLGALLFLYNATQSPCNYYRISHPKLGVMFMKTAEPSCNIKLPQIEYRFDLGTPVEKFTGDYTWAGIVVSRFATTAGAERYVVEHKADTGGVLHIYGPNNIRLREVTTG